MLDATRPPLSDLVPPGYEEDIYSTSYRQKGTGETLLRMFVTDAWREKGSDSPHLQHEQLRGTTNQAFFVD